MSEQLPKEINFEHFAQQGTALKGSLLANDMPRLSEKVGTSHSQIAFELKFDKDMDGISFLSGNLQTELSVTCQRCMKTMPQKIEAEFNLSPIDNELNFGSLPSCYEPVVMTQGSINLHDVIEDELLIHLPNFPLHEPSECDVKLEEVIPNKEFSNDEKPNPFSALRELTKDLGDKHGSTKES